ncbi:signal transduction histidine kinase [Silvimonas iriomotensis]|uniref:histidine kinase n=3 Tax=Chitinibacteraceae TaxID=2897177 RepID=A0ABQ2PAX9_9NEIS|nr:signal transduction histidine kinase [Silvimonas iriomotensis]GGP27054.1 signal transduction histidine kinase [Silvimonas amylolytica]
MDHAADIYAFGEILQHLMGHTEPAPALVEPYGFALELLAEITARLLHTDHHARYPSASAIQADLYRVLAALKGLDNEPATQTIAQTGIRDRSALAFRPPRVYGRKREFSRLFEHMARVAETGDSAAVLISGAAGSGKSTLIEALRADGKSTSWRFASGKFDQQKLDSPYQALLEATGSLISRLQTSGESPELLQIEAQQAVGGLGRLITDAIPEAAWLLGQPAPAPEVSTERVKARWHDTLARFIGVFARPANPLLLFIDDLQWADTATLEFMAETMTHRPIKWLFLAGATRDTENLLETGWPARVRAASHDAADIEVLALSPLSREAIGNLLNDFLGTGQDEVTQLVDFVHTKAAGNPLFAIQLVRKIVDERIVTKNYVSQRWEWVPAQLLAALETTDLPSLVRFRVNALPLPSQGVIALFACMGNVATNKRLGLVTKLDEAVLYEQLLPALRAGLILNRGEEYFFVHDRIREVMYAMLDAEVRAQCHLRIAETIKLDRPVVARQFELATHLNKAAVLLDSESLRLDAAQENFEAAQLAKVTGALDAAVFYLDSAQQLLGPIDPDIAHPLRTRILVEAARCELARGNLQACQNVLGILEKPDLSKERTIEKTLIAVTLNVMQSNNVEAAQIALACLRQYCGVDLSQYPDEAEIHAAFDAVFSKLGNREIESLVSLPDLNDVDATQTMSLLSSLLLPSFYTSLGLFLLHIAKMAELALDRGINATAAYSFSALGVAIGELLGRYEDGYRFGVLAKELVFSRGYDAVKARTLVSLQMASLWTQPLDVALKVIKMARDAADESGEIDISCTTRSLLVTNMLAIGSPLDEVRQAALSGQLFVVRAGFGDLADMLAIQLAFIDALADPEAGTQTLDNAVFAEAGFEQKLTSNANASLVCMYWVMKGRLRCMAGQFDEAEAAFLEAEKVAWSLPGFFQMCDYHFFGGLTAAALLRDKKSPHVTRRAERLQVAIERLSRWAYSCESTFSGKHELLLAEAARAEGNQLEALARYDAAIRASSIYGLAHDEGLVLERAAGYCQEHGLTGISRGWLQQAHQAWSRWGAMAKAAELERQNVHLLSRTDLAGQAGPRLRDKDIQFLAETTRAMSSEIVVEQLIEKLLAATLTYTGASFGLFVRRNTQPEVLASLVRDLSSETGFRTTASATPSTPFWHGMLMEQHPVVFDGTEVKLRFPDEEYFRTHGASFIVCIPLIKQGRSLGVLYLEQHEPAKLPTPGKLAVLEMIAAQAAVSMEVARLYADASEENHQRKRIELTLRENETVLAQTQRVGGTAHWIWHVTSGQVDCSPELAHMLRIEQAEAVGTIPLEVILERLHHDDRSAVIQNLNDAALHQRGFRIQFRSLGREDVRYFQAIGEPQLAGPDTLRFIGTTIDITERELREQALQLARSQLSQATRVYTLGQLAASITHEVNQPLAAIIANGLAGLRWLQRDTPDFGEVVSALQRVVQEGERANQVIGRTRGLIKGSQPQRSSIHLGELLQETLALMRREVQTHSISIQLSLEENIPATLIDQVQIQQVLINLLANAIDVLSTVHDRRRIISVFLSFIAGDGILLQITDNGPGVAPVNRERIFTPFYSTKSEGLGIGLSMCRTIVEAHGGTIVLDEQTEGATFSVRLPLTAETSA